MAQRFDISNLTASGDLTPISNNVAVGDATDGILSASREGHIVYRTNTALGQRQLVWYDRSGTELSRIGSAATSGQFPSLSPDGRTMAISRVVEGNRDIWLLDLARSVFTRLTFDPAADSSPLWSKDGTRIFFASPRNGRLNLFSKTIGGAAETPLLVTDQNTVTGSVSPDGETLLYLVADPQTLLNIWAMPLTGGRKPFAVVESPREDLNGQISPNGRWLAYQSNESGRHEVSVRRFPNGIPVQVSVEGGTQPRWSADGRELYYLDLQERLTAVTIAFSSDGRVEAGPPAVLFQTRIGGANINQKEYLVSPDGRFLLDTPVGDASRPLTVILNWQPPQ